ncbi:PREDICTED: non-specific lipid-transfer protein-like protein At2g13820 isoform X1 [Lupinus angustifolius]|uniref:non-specific lipid-transfer protein-like protein At2g13820 isoform X1 n=1 Tax=Lupinus angustifolius TaxID=3871 RepID=UPI00092F42BD|nr:PREDICTED: non-specific lipid-transfer protein-like protein At2g13820 isoform X1 [Lupinus angustifolius]
MASKTLFSICIIFSSYIHQAFSSDSNDLDQLLGGLKQISALHDAQCMQKLIPCKTAMNSSTIINPSPTCCIPLNEILTNNTECLCSFINNPKLLASMNVTKDDLLKLPDSCGLKADISICDKESSSSPSPTSADLTPTVPADKAPPAEDSKSSTKMVTPYESIHFCVPGFVTLWTALVFSAY